MQNKNILIVGGNSGIGEKLVKRLSEKGANIYAANRNGFSSLPSGISIQEVDVTADEFTLNLPDELHGLVYCPGSINLKPFDRIKLETYVEDMNINFYGAVKVLQQALPVMRKTGDASVVGFSTVAVNTGMPFHASVAAAKGALEGLFRSLAAEYAPKVRFNIIAPSLTDTPMAKGLLGSDRKKEASAERHPLKTVGEADQMAAMAQLLLSDEGSWISGQTMHIDGGMSNLKP
ncbi:MAG: SDR family oxidoreductase [Cryomorphaceae bacterium]|nr:SDR family oxidoreductase [Cryomorphaceae bacterium]